MKQLFASLFKIILVLIVFVAGCARYDNSRRETTKRNSIDLDSHCMSEKGEWTGEGRLITLFEFNGKQVSALALIIGPGQVKKETIGGRPVLIDSHLKLLDPKAYAGKLIKVKGTIYPEYPINPGDGAKLQSIPPETTNNEVRFTAVEVIKVSPQNIVITGSVDNKSGP